MSTHNATTLETLLAELEGLRMRQRELELRLGKQEELNRLTQARVALAEQQVTRLTRLYVASLHLLGARQPEQVLEAVQEIIVNIIGSEELAIFRMGEDGKSLWLVSSLGVDPERLRSIPLGEGPIGKTALEDKTFIAPTPRSASAEPGDTVTACVPLRLDGRVYGVIALFGLLPQKPALEDVDRELLELFADQAAPALHRVAR
jgi:GAF domain-containing protein